MVIDSWNWNRLVNIKAGLFVSSKSSKLDP